MEYALPLAPTFQSDVNSTTHHNGDQRYFSEAAHQGEAGPAEVLAHFDTDYARWEDSQRYSGYELYRDMVSDKLVVPCPPK